VAIKHLVAHTRGGWRNVVRWDSARWLWERLREAFADAIANLFMPDHLHLVTPTDPHARDRLRRVLQHHTRRFGAGWDVGPEQVCNTRPILRRTIRYVFLNAVEDGLTDDPLRWAWSSFRNALGLTADRWCGTRTIRSRVGLASGGLHRYVTDDGRCSASARQQPPTAVPSGGIVASLDAVASACASVLREHVRDVGRRGSPMRAAFIDVSLAIGMPPIPALAEFCGITPRAVHQLRGRTAPSILDKAIRCLTDPRLRTWR
jgi:hypothetical protein